MNMYLQLFLFSLLPVVASIVLYYLDKKTAFSKLSNKWKQLIYGLIFGAIAVAGTEFGVDVGGAVINVRDASVLAAGLIFGSPAGIIAGLIGGIERFFAVYWGAGMYTRLACSISTVLAGLIGAALRKYMFDNKKPSWFYALCIGLVTEVIHMLMIFLTNMGDIKTAFVFVETCSVPMIVANGLSLMLSVIAVTLIGKDKIKASPKNRHITTLFQRWLLVCVLFAFIITSVFTLFIQNSISDNDTKNLLTLNLKDVEADISDASDENLLDLTHRIADNLNKKSSVTNDDLNILANDNGIAEIDVINDKGIITASTTSDFLGYDMSSGKQSAEFMCLLSGETEYVQSYQPISYNSDISRKYAGVALENGGFVQVGYDAEHLQADIDETVAGLTKNRHIGSNGSIIIVDQNMNLVSSREDYEGEVFDRSSIPEKAEQNTVFTGSVYQTECYCMYVMDEGYYIIAVLPVSEAEFSRNISEYVMVFMEIVIFVGLFIVIYFLIKKLVVDNIRKVNSSLAQITGGNLDIAVDVRTNDEFSSLSDDINATVITLKRYIAEAAARIDKELEFARSIQHSALPSVFPPYPNRDDFDIYATMDAAKEVGGDFYDFYLTGNNSLVFLIADVSGKGIPAAMFMMRAKTLIKGYAEAGMDVDKLLTLVNNKLCEGNDAEMFVTAWIGKIDLDNGHIEFSNAGHNPPVVKHADESFEYVKSSSGFVLGGMEDIKYVKDDLYLNSGERIFLYTDGVTEATDSDTELYGEDRLSDILNASSDCNSAELCAAVKKEDVDAFVGDAPQFDDITMMSLIYKGDDGNIKKLSIDATVDNIEKVTDFVNKELEDLDCPMKAQTQIDVAIDELFGNIAHYAYDPSVGKATVCVEVCKEPLSVIITFTDNGKPYDPLSKEDPDTAKSAEERTEGGLGIYIVKKSMDDIAYEYKDGRNILTIRKNLK